jgi:hypothetical protein
MSSWSGITSERTVVVLEQVFFLARFLSAHGTSRLRCVDVPREQHKLELRLCMYTCKGIAQSPFCFLTFSFVFTCVMLYD